MLPQDPMILLSYVNMKLRDEYTSLYEFCEEMDTDMDALVAKLATAGFHYEEATNQFR